MKIVWLCSYSLQCLKDLIPNYVPASKFHPTTWMHYLVQEMQKHTEHELHVVTSLPYVDKDRMVKDKSITFHLLRRGIPLVKKGFPYFFRIDTFTNYYFLRRKIQLLIRKINPDIVNAHGTEDVYSLALGSLAMPSVVWIQGLMTLIARDSETSWVRKQVSLERKVFRSGKYFISNCPIFDPMIRRENPGARIFYLSYPVADMAFTMEREKPDADVVFTGSLLRRKGIEDFIEAVRIAAKMLPGIHAKVIGGNRNKLYMDFLMDRIRSYSLAGNITFLGFLPDHRDVLREMSKSKVMMLPSHADTGPRAVAECMALGIPVIAYNVDGLPWMIEDGVRGMLVEKGNTEALGEQLLLLLKDSERRRALTENAKDFAREHFDARTIVKRLLDIYEDILQRQC